MPTFPIMNPKQFTLDLLSYLKQAYSHLRSHLKSQHPQQQQQQQQNHISSTFNQRNLTKHPNTFDEVLNAYNRSKSRKKLENDAVTEQQQQLNYLMETDARVYQFSDDRSELENNITMVLKALVAVMKSNAGVEIQCIGNFEMIFGFLSDNLLKEVKN